MRGAFRSRVAFCSLGLVLGVIWLPACNQKKKEVGSAKASANQSLQDFKTQVGKLQAATADLRARFKALPEDLPDIEPVHSTLFSVEEVLGVEGARIQWLSGELNAAFTTGKREQIQKVSDEIRGSIAGNKDIERAIIKLTDQLLPFERLAAQRRTKFER